MLTIRVWAVARYEAMWYFVQWFSRVGSYGLSVPKDYLTMSSCVLIWWTIWSTTYISKLPSAFCLGRAGSIAGCVLFLVATGVESGKALSLWSTVTKWSTAERFLALKQATLGLWILQLMYFPVDRDFVQSDNSKWKLASSLRQEVWLRVFCHSFVCSFQGWRSVDV